MKKIKGVLKSKGNQGFTLLEILSVIIILGALATIAVGVFGSNAESAKAIANASNIKLLMNQVQMYIMEQGVSGLHENVIDDMVAAGNLKAKPINPFKDDPVLGRREYIVSLDSNSKPVATLASPSNGKYNKPELTSGMMPVVWAGALGATTTFDPVTTTVDDANWYSYQGDINDHSYATTEKWANVRTKDGSYFVWIPRHTYKILGPKSIQIRYSLGLADDLSNGFKLHPAFSFGGKQLTGLWVAKFEATAEVNGVNAVDNDSATNKDNQTSKKVAVKPDVPSWRYINIGNMFQVCKNMKSDRSIYGWKSNEIDTHPMKNTEWGCVAYLAEAIRDGDEIYINNSVQGVEGGGAGCIVKTGYSGASATAGKQSAGNTVYRYETAEGQKASTTGNVYGIYDINGGSWEYTAAYLNNGHGNLNTNGSQLLSAVRDYVDVYEAPADNLTVAWGTPAAAAVGIKATVDLWASHIGDALYEVIENKGVNSVSNPTSEDNYNDSWYSDYQRMPRNGSQFFLRGGGYINGSNAGAFACSDNSGIPIDLVSLRPVVVVLMPELVN